MNKIKNIQAFIKTEAAIHRVAQFISLTGINLLEKKEDDRHTNMEWLENERKLAGRYFSLKDMKARLVLNIPAFTIAFEDEQGDIISEFPAGDRSCSEIMDWWRNEMKNLGFEGELTEKLHYELPDTKAYQEKTLKKPAGVYISAWMDLRTQANKALKTLNEISGFSSGIRIWPHHFDTAVYYPLIKKDGQDTESVGAGLAIADSMIEEPYYFVYGWRRSGDIDYSDAPELPSGKWLTNDWQGSVLRYSELKDLQQLTGFFNESYQFLKNKLEN